MIADGHTMRVAGQILQHTLGTAERSLGVHYPLPGGQRRQPACESVGISPTAEASLRKRLPQQGQVLSPEHATEYAHRQEETGPARPPTGRGLDDSLSVARQATPRHDTMHMRMVVQVLPPGVQH